MERKFASSRSLHALEITRYSSPIHFLDSPLGVLPKSSKYLFGRRSRSTLQLSSSPSNVSTLPSRIEPTPKRTDSLPNLHPANLSQSKGGNNLQPSVNNAASVLPTTDSTFSISSPLIKLPSTFRTSSVSLITSTFRKFRARRVEPPQFNGDTVANECEVNANTNETVATPSLPTFPALSPFLQPAHQSPLSTTQSMSTISLLTAPDHALRSTYSDSTMHLHSEREPVPLFTRHQWSPNATFAEGAVVYPRSANSSSSKESPTSLTEKRDGNGGLGIVGLLYCAKQGKYSVIGGLVGDDKPVSEEFVTVVELETDGMEDDESQEDEDEGIMIDAGVVILSEPRVKPAPSHKQTVNRVLSPPVKKPAVPKNMPQSPLAAAPQLIIASHPMSREKHTGSATETAISSGSGTEAGASGRSVSGSHSDSGSGKSHALVDEVDYADITDILGIFPESERGNASNRVDFGLTLPEGSSPNLRASVSNQRVPRSKSQRSVSPGLASALLQSPLLLGLGHPVSHLEQPQASHTSSSLWSGKRSQSLVGLFARSTPGSASPSASSTGSSTRVKKSTIGLGMLGKRGKKEQGDVLLDYAQVAHLMELKDEK